MGAISIYLNKFLLLVNKPFKTFYVKDMQIDATYWQAVTIVFLIFLLLLTLARMRYLYVHWSTGKSAIAFMFWGALLTVIFEGLFIIGGRTIFTELMGWKTAPKPISTFLDIGREKLAESLKDTKAGIPSTFAHEQPTYQSVIFEYDSLTRKDRDKVSSYICEPASKLKNEAN